MSEVVGSSPLPTCCCLLQRLMLSMTQTAQSKKCGTGENDDDDGKERA